MTAHTRRPRTLKYRKLDWRGDPTFTRERVKILEAQLTRVLDALDEVLPTPPAPPSVPPRGVHLTLLKGGRR